VESGDRKHPDERASLTHLDSEGRARMVDVSQKPDTRRRARARAVVVLTPEVRRAVLAGELPKGEALAVARIAGIQAAKETSRLIPLCHPLALSSVEIDLAPEGEDRIAITSDVRCSGPTGVEMEALTAVSVAALTLYDMCKALHRGIEITGVALCHKSGGRSGEWNRDSEVQ
jgi:cyclic pyranopterin phosphate synthase